MSVVWQDEVARPNNLEGTDMKHKICRLIITKRVYRWVCENMDAALLCMEAGVPLDRRMRFARWFVHATV